MFITRRTLLVGGASGATAAFLAGHPASAEELFEGVAPGEAPGDYGYKHAEYHRYYQQVFGEPGHCLCGSGDCRVTDWRETKLDSPIGYDVIAYRRWMPLPDEVWIPEPEQVPNILRHERAHICAYNAEGVSIQCAIINAIQT